ncbi:MAG: cytidine deaminase [Treponema sp.]|jgi:cytidine deaminase|nr:cytidine deaminase [Treponema sp.]
MADNKSNAGGEKLDLLFQTAREAAEAAYAPYSRFRVGAALLAEDGTVYSGCNVENRSFGLTICAERNALCQGVAKGRRAFIALAIVTPDSKEPVGPGAACRQVLRAFMGSGAPVRFGNGGPARVDTTMGDLLPYDSLHDLAKESAGKC